MTDPYAARLLRIVFLVVLAGAAVLYVYSTWTGALAEHKRETLNLAAAAEAGFHRSAFSDLAALPGDLGKPQYRRIKDSLTRMVRVNPHVRFAYILVLKEGKVFFLADSEPETSPDYSPPGQEYTEADNFTLSAFSAESLIVTPPTTDRWGRWVSILVPMRDPETEKIYAVFGLDYPAQTWYAQAAGHTAGALGFAVSLYLLAVAVLILLKKNSSLKKETISLVKTNALLGSTMECQPGVIIFSLDHSGRYLTFNENHRKAVRATWSVDIAVGTNMLDEVIRDHPDRNKMRQNMDRALCGESFVELEESIDDSDARSYWQSFWAPIAVTDGEIIGMTCIRLNIDEQKRLEVQLRESERILARAQAVARLGYYITDVKTGTWTSSSILDELFGIDASYPRSYAGWRDLIHPECRERLEEFYKTLGERNRKFANEYRIIRHDDGQLRWISDTGEAECDENGNEIYHIGTVQDITDRKMAEETIAALNAGLEKKVRERTAQLESANRELEAFSHSVSHDLRAPLRAIEGFSQLLSDRVSGILEPESMRYLGVIRSNARRMEELITGLLELSRMSRDAISYARLDMTALAESTVQEILPDEIRSSFEISLQSLPPAWGDAILIRQVWFNLISNAAKYSMKSSTRKIAIGAETENEETVYYIRDSGAGFDPAYAYKLFGPFQRLHRADEFEGSGIGLALVQRIILRHKGRIWAEGKVGEGATFRFFLPKAENAELGKS